MNRRRLPQITSVAPVTARQCFEFILIPTHRSQRIARALWSRAYIEKYVACLSMLLEPICPQLIKSRLEIVEDNGIAETLEDKGELYLSA